MSLHIVSWITYQGLKNDGREHCKLHQKIFREETPAMHLKDQLQRKVNQAYQYKESHEGKYLPNDVLSYYCETIRARKSKQKCMIKLPDGNYGWADLNQRTEFASGYTDYKFGRSKWFNSSISWISDLFGAERRKDNLPIFARSGRKQPCRSVKSPDWFCNSYRDDYLSVPGVVERNYEIVPKGQKVEL